MRKCLIAVLFSFGATSLVAAPVQWNTGVGANNNWYEVVLSRISWAEARAAALASTYMGEQGYLVSITSQEEQDFLNVLYAPYYNVPNAEQAWLGGTDNDVDSSEGDWIWVDGPEHGTLISAGYDNWLPGHPNSGGGSGVEEDALVGWFNGTQWNDLPANFNRIYIVEYGAGSPISPVPVPAAGLMLFGGLAGFAIAFGRRRKRI